MAEKDKIPAQQVKELRDKTGVSVMECKRALEEAHGDMEKACLLISEKALETAKKRQEKEASQGLIECYTHIGQQIGSMLEINCETDFVARNEEFGEMAHLIALQIAACNPTYLDREAVPAEVIKEETEKYRARCEAEGKPEKVWDRIVEGTLEKFFQEVCLLEQPFVKDPSVSVGELITQTSAKLGEKIAVRRFARFQIGEE